MARSRPLLHRSWFICHFQRHFSKSRRPPAKKKEEGFLSSAERCKNFMVANWRGQLTTVKPKLSDKEEQKKAERTYGELVKYILVSGKPLVYLPQKSDHCPNLLFDNRASLILGHTDPPALMKAFRKVKKVPPHTIFVGTLSLSEDDEMLSLDIVKTLIKKQKSELERSIKYSSPAARAILESGSSVLQMHVKALSSMLEFEGDDSFYKFEPSSCHFIEGPGKKFALNLEKIGDSCGDCLSPLLPAIIEGINKNDERRLGLRLLCAWYLRIHVEDAFVSSADSWGLNILAMTAINNEDASLGSPQNAQKAGAGEASTAFEWRDLRLTFVQAAQDLNEFCSVLAQMERASLISFQEIKARTSGPAEQTEYSET